jgi:outer membrane lipoprotein SlyB
MNHAFLPASLALAAGLALPAIADAQMRVQYGRITHVQPVTVTDNSPAPGLGTLVGGGIGLASGRNQSSSNRALRGVAGAAAGRAVGGAVGQSQAFEYTVLGEGGTTVRIVSDQAGKRVGDCVSVEQGQFANIRLVDDSRCAPRAQGAPARTPPRSDAQRAGACDEAKAQVLAATTDDQFAIAERRMRLLCGE